MKRFPHLPRMDLIFAYSAFPCAVLPPTAQKPVMPSSFRACLRPSANFFKGLVAKLFLESADTAFDTTLPRLFLVNWFFLSPPPVFSLLPLKTSDLLNLPVAILLTFIAFIAFVASIAFITFIAVTTFMAFTVLATFMALAAFVAFIATAIVYEHQTAAGGEWIASTGCE